MSYLVRLVPELTAWLAELRLRDPARARRAGAAITVLLTEGERVGPPLVVPTRTAAQPDPRAALEGSYQRLLGQLSEVRRAVAEVAAARKRLEVQISQLASAGGSTQPTQPLHELRDQHARLGMEEARLSAGARQLQTWVSEFRSRKEALKASYTVAQAQRVINHAYAEFADGSADTGAPYPAADDTAQDLASSITAIGAALSGEAPPSGAAASGPGQAAVPEPGRAAPGPAGPGRAGQPEATLLELRCGWPARQAQRILFTVQDGGPLGDPSPVALLLAAGPTASPLRGRPDELIPVAQARYRAVRDHAGRGQPGPPQPAESFLAEFFQGKAESIQVAAFDLATRVLPRQPGELRRQAGVTQAELASRLGVRQERVSAIERADPGAAEVRTLAGYVQALGGRLVLVADFGADQVILG